MNELVRGLYCSIDGDETTLELDCGDVHPVVLFYPDKIHLTHLIFQNHQLTLSVYLLDVLQIMQHHL